jgi:hypothetical protein
MSRAYNPMISAYLNMDIENMPSETQTPKDTGGMMVRKTMMKTDMGLDMTQPAVRMAKQMKVIRDARNEIDGV